MKENLEDLNNGDKMTSQEQTDSVRLEALLSNMIFYETIYPLKRARLQKLQFKVKTRELISKVNQALKEVLQNTDVINKIQTAMYAAAVTVLSLND